MKRNKQASIEIHADIEEFDKARVFVEDLLNRSSVSREIARETKLVFEAVFGAVLMQGVDRSTMLRVSAEDRLGNIYLKIGYEGERFRKHEKDDDISPELRLLEGYADRVSRSYQFGYNTIRVSIHKNQWRQLLSCGVGVLLAIVVYVVINQFASPGEQKTLLDNYVFPFERLFANAMLMVGAPVTFFSLLKNASDALAVSVRTTNTQKLHFKSVVTSSFAVLLALGLSFAPMLALSDWRGYDAGSASGDVGWSFSEGVVSMIPASIFEPFESLSPIPLIVVAMLVTYALVSAERDFDALKAAIDVCYRLFSRMLSAVMVALPVASFLAIMNVLLEGGRETLINTLVLIVFILVSTHVLFATYALRLKLKGIALGPYTKRIIPLLHENRAIGSAIDAVPLNVRYCAKHYGMDRRRISYSLPVLAQISRDGNCFLLMLIAMLYVFAADVEVSMIEIAIIAALVLFLSFGSPNQPGSILIGALIIITYLNCYNAICTAIYLEVFLGAMQSSINVISNIISVTEEEGVRFVE